MKYILLTTAFVLALSFVCFSQTASDETKCPNIKLMPPPNAVKSGQTMTFAVDGSEIPNVNAIKYIWSVDKGTIISGQRTDKVKVSTDGLSNETITASVKIEGLPKSCNNEFTETGIVIGEGHYPPLIDEFGNLYDDDVKARIDAFIIELQNAPNTYGYIINYGSIKDVKKRERVIKNFLKSRRYDESRIVFKNGGIEKEIRTRLWLILEGVDVTYLD